MDGLACEKQKDRQGVVSDKQVQSLRSKRGWLGREAAGPR